MNAIIYTTNTGSTECYARLLTQKTELPAYSLAEAKKRVFAGTEIIYLGWIMAGSVKGYARPQSAIRYAPSAVSAWDRPERKRTACGKSRRFQPVFRCSHSRGTLMSKSCTASTAS